MLNHALPEKFCRSGLCRWPMSRSSVSGTHPPCTEGWWPIRRRCWSFSVNRWWLTIHNDSRWLITYNEEDHNSEGEISGFESGPETKLENEFSWNSTINFKFQNWPKLLPYILDSVRILKMHAKGGFSTLVDYIMRTTIIMRDYGYIWLAQIDLATPDPLQLPPLGLPLLHHPATQPK